MSSSVDRTSPDHMAWLITPDTVFKHERHFHELSTDFWVIEEYDPETDTWTRYEGDGLRLSCYRAPEEE